jgi:phospholipase C
MENDSEGLQRIEHFFVLMLENRSFDHMFGAFAHLQSTPMSGTEICPLDPADPRGPAVAVQFSAPDITDPDPPHEFLDVYYQMTGRRSGGYSSGPLPMDGFAASAAFGLLEGEGGWTKHRKRGERVDGGYALNGQSTDRIPVLRTLAEQYAVCENWYSSMPGPTWPNRFFIHAASAGGLSNSPKMLEMGKAMTLDELGFDFEHGTIYDRLGTGNWRIYHGDLLPQALAIKGLARSYVGAAADSFRRVEFLRDDLQDSEFAPKYVFIEPNHSIITGSRLSNSQHPPGRVMFGEQLIKYVYDAISRSPLWEKSALLIVYDEHGGFFDRRSPPEVAAPGDEPLNAHKAEYPHVFDFTRLGPRVPAVIVSPWIEAGTVDPTLYDHSSLLKTLEQRFGLSALTRRDEGANGFGGVFNRSEPRTDTPELSAEAGDYQPFADVREAVEPEDDESSEDDIAAGSLAGFVRIAMTVEHLRNEKRATLRQKLAHHLLGNRFPSLALTRVPPIRTRQEARKYIAGVVQQIAVPVPVEIG